MAHHLCWTLLPIVLQLICSDSVQRVHFASAHPGSHLLRFTSLELPDSALGLRKRGVEPGDLIPCGSDLFFNFFHFLNFNLT